MKGFLFFKWLKDVSLTKKLYFVVSIMALLIAVELFTLSFMVHTLSSTRALVGAEGLWSKAQKDAVYSLTKYGYTHNEKDYRKYLSLLAVPLGDRVSRVELMKPKPNLDTIRRGFIQGEFNPGDIDGAIKLFIRFHNISYIHNAIVIWTKGDYYLAMLQYLGDRLHKQVSNGTTPVYEINQTQEQIYQLNEILTVLENNFSDTLGEGSRWIEHLVLKILFLIAITVEFTGLFLTVSVSRAISKGINEVVRIANTIAQADFSDRAKVYSNDEIGLLATSFNKMIDDLQNKIIEEREAEEQLRKEKERAESAEISKRIGEQFLANMSHEIRTPMNAIVGFTDIMLKTPLKAEQHQYLEAIKMSGDNLLVIINDILDFSRMKSGKIPIENRVFKLSQIITMCSELMHPKATEKGIELSIHIDKNIPDDLMGDPTRLNQVLLNFTANAIKFTTKGEVTINAKLLSATEDEVYLELMVKDSGIGIPKDKLNTIFEPFIQADTDIARRYGGTGLGLAIVKQLAELQNGSVEVLSEEGKGSCFYFRIKYKRADTLIVADKIAVHAPKKKIKYLKVLLVEDNRMNQILARKVLSDWGWEVDIVENGMGAIEKLNNKDFDIVLMDIQMPKMDGYEATRFIRNNLPAPKCNVPIMAMTAHVMPTEEEKCYQVGMNGYISKPFDTDVLYNKIASIV